jgi:hypothetical protein
VKMGLRPKLTDHQKREASLPKGWLQARLLELIQQCNLCVSS